jgi:hypothetical protein
MSRTIWQRLQSRKFLAWAASVAFVLVALFAHEINWVEASRSILTISTIYLGVEGVIDYKALPKGGGN